MVVLTADMLHALYGIVADVSVGSDGVPHVVPLASVRNSPREEALQR